mmetsp:Transcript_4197/g.8493  ORF Transcript_4197/g.8493 Transcript_4197/m.8493 type:complete len:86 (+) Transcript_4197:1088-1345(+)
MPKLYSAPGRQDNRRKQNLAPDEEESFDKPVIIHLTLPQKGVQTMMYAQESSASAPGLRFTRVTCYTKQESDHSNTRLPLAAINL